jgi:hypothetical protein
MRVRRPGWQDSGREEDRFNNEVQDYIPFRIMRSGRLSKASLAPFDSGGKVMSAPSMIAMYFARMNWFMKRRWKRVDFSTRSKIRGHRYQVAEKK